MTKLVTVMELMMVVRMMRGGGIESKEMEARLILMHRIENQLYMYKQTTEQ